MGVTPTSQNKGVNYACARVANQTRPLYHVTLNCCKIDAWRAILAHAHPIFPRLVFAVEVEGGGGGIKSEVEVEGGGGGIKFEVEVEVVVEVVVEVSSLKWRCMEVKVAHVHEIRMARNPLIAMIILTS